MCTAPRVEDLDLTGVDIVAVDLETWDPELKTKGSGAVRGIGKVCGIVESVPENKHFIFQFVIKILIS